MTISIPRILMSAAMIVFVGALVIGGTGAFFSDEETSTGNVFTAGALDLKIDSVQHYNGMVCAETDVDSGQYIWVPNGEATLDDEMHAVVNDDFDQTEIDNFNDANPAQFPQAGVECTGSWRLADDNGEGQPIIGQFWDFDDIKPGDQGENTISIHVDNNDAWMCASLENVSEADNGQTEPEDLVDPDGDAAGELDDNLYFFGWLDNGNNIYEPEEGETSFGDPILASELADGTWALADSETNGGVPVAGDETHYIGVYWCAGTIDTNGGAGPLTCDGESMGNEAQTDSWTTDLKFYIEQSRNNPDFVCNPEEEPEEEGRPVGAVLADYDAPIEQACDALVENDESIQAALDSEVSPGEIVCVDSTYDRTGDDVAIRMEQAGVTLAALVQGILLDVPVVLSADGVTVTGFEGTIGQAESPAEQAAFYFDGDATNASLTFNEVNGGVGAAVLTETNADNSGGLIENNVLSGATQGIYINPHTGSILIRYNDIDGNAAGIGGFTGASIVANEFDGNSEAIGADSSYDGVSAITNNNFLTSTDKVIKYGVWPAFDLTPPDVIATENFWVDGGAAMTEGAVDFSSEAGVPFPHNS